MAVDLRKMQENKGFQRIGSSYSNLRICSLAFSER